MNLYQIIHDFICFTAINERLSNGLDISVGAAVGLLSRNIKIIGEDYTDLYEESYGARVLIGLITSQGQTYTGTMTYHSVSTIHTELVLFISII